MSSVYLINKGVNRPVVFHGLKAQYIWWLGIGLAILLLLFVFMYIAGIQVVVCMVLVFGLGAFLFWWVYRLSNQYGEYGLMKEVASKRIPNVIKCDIVFT